jgi:hypothetical protein
VEALESRVRHELYPKPIVARSRSIDRRSRAGGEG